MATQTELENAIAVLEAQRSILGNAVVDTAIAPMHEKLDALEHPGRKAAGIGLPTERKLITIFFADVVGSTALAESLGAESSRLILDRCLRRVSHAVDEFGGTVSSLMGDGLMAFFGVPRAFEDDAERAVLAAQRSHELVQEYARELGRSVQVRVGINTGRTVLGEMGGEVHAEYTAMGPPVNMAARLQSAAEPGSTLLGESTARMVRYRFQVEAIEPLILKGFEEPVAAYEPFGELAQPVPARGISGLLSPLVGRDEELRQLTDKVSGLEQGIGGIAALIGEPGIGKSRLLYETQLATEDYNLRFTEGRAYSYTQDQPFSVTLDLLAELLDLSADDSPAIRDLKLEAALGPLFEGELETVWPFLASLLGAPVPPHYADTLDGLDPEALNARIIGALRLLVGRLATAQPLVLAFEDLHWADRASLQLIETLLLDTENSPLFLVLLFRPDRDKPVWQLKQTAETYYAHRYLELMLQPLDEQAGEQLMKNLLDVANFPADLRRTIGGRAQGNPLYVEEIIRSLIDSDILVCENDRWELNGDANELQVPETLEKVILARFDRLPAAERETLQAASVIGRRFSYRVLADMLSINGDLPGRLLRLQQVGLVRERSRLPELEYIFKHVIVQEVTYATLLREQRRRLHTKAAEILEALFPDRHEEFAGTLAEHYAEAGKNEKAIPFFLEAATRASAMYASEEALNFLQRAHTLAQDDDMESLAYADLLERLGDAHYVLREMMEAFELFEEALALRKRLGDADLWTRVRLLRKIAEAWWELPEKEDEMRLEERAVACMREAMALVEDQLPNVETIRLLSIVSHCSRAMQAESEKWRIWVNEWQNEGAIAQKAVDIAEALGAPVELSKGLSVLGRYYNGQDRIRDHIRVQQRRMEISRDPRFDDMREKLEILIETAMALKMAGEYGQALPLVLEAEELGEGVQDLYSHAYALLLQAEFWMRLDRWDEVIQTEKKMQALQRRYPLKKLGPICWLLGYGAAAHFLRGEMEIGERQAAESFEIMRGLMWQEESDLDHWSSPQFY